MNGEQETLFAGAVTHGEPYLLTNRYNLLQFLGSANLHDLERRIKALQRFDVLGVIALDGDDAHFSPILVFWKASMSHLPLCSASRASPTS